MIRRGRGRWRGGGFTPKAPVANINEHIAAPEVRVIDTDGSNLGVMPTEKGVAIAKEKGLDLIEIAPQAKPPVARVMSYDKFRYQKEKEEKKKRELERKAETEMRAIRISARAAKNDLEIKAGKVREFLAERSRVEIQLMLRGREKGNKDWARQKVNEFLQSLGVPYKIVTPLTFGGRGGSLQIAPEK
ncbi:MAG: translation initiation factor IF-3 [Candidatus Liptonbacteria bacterium]|nr:translation initiation factor IF-3 [Candidatus Liptonbacteria bacterium]